MASALKSLVHQRVRGPLWHASCAMDALRAQWLDGQEAPAYSEIGPYSFQVRPEHHAQLQSAT
jgi:hypothetical protein